MDAKCPRCGSKYDIEPDEIGRRVKCEVCGNRFVIDVRCFRRYIVSLFSYSGRIWRREYLKALAVVAVPVAVVAAMVVVGVIADPPADVGMAWNLWFWPTMTFCILAAPASIRRLHDISLSGKWYCVIAGIALIIPSFGIMAGFPSVLVIVVDFLTFLILACIPGTRGSNKYDGILRRPENLDFHWWDWAILVLFTLGAILRVGHIIKDYVESAGAYYSDTNRQPSIPVFSEVRDLKDVVTRECDEISNDCLYRHSGWGLKIEQVIDGKGVLVEHKDWREHGQDIFIKMNTDDLVDGDPLPPVTVKYIGIYRYQTVSGAERSVRAFKVVKKYKISSE